MGIVVQRALHLYKSADAVNLPRIIVGRPFPVVDYTNFLMLLFVCMPLVDTINGLMIRGVLPVFIPVAKVYRLLLLCVLASMCVKRVDIKPLILLLGVFAIGMFAVLLHALTGLSTNRFDVEIQDLAQWLFVPFCCLVLLKLNQSRKIDLLRFARTSFALLAWLVPLTILIPYVLGVGYSTYSGGVGYKGFYYANNGISLLASVVFSYSFYNLISGRILFSRLIPVLMCFVTLLLIGTKAALFSVVFGMIVAFIASSSSRGRSNRTASSLVVKIILVLMFVAALLVVLVFSFADYVNSLLSRITYMANVHDGVLSWATSGRVDRISSYVQLWDKEGFPISFLLGVGDHAAELHHVEMDYFDILFEFGLVGMVGLLTFSFFVAYKSLAAADRFDFYMVVFCLCYAAIVGHLFSNAMSSMTFVLVFASAISGNERHRRSFRNLSTPMLVS